MPDLLVTDHAVERYQERVANCTADQARQALSSPAVRAAAKFGAMFVRLATGHRIALRGHVVLTVLPPEHFKRQVHRVGLPRFTNPSNTHKGGDHA